MDKLSEHAIRMLEITDANDIPAIGNKQFRDIARAVYDVILQVQMLKMAKRKTEPHIVGKHADVIIIDESQTERERVMEKYSVGEYIIYVNGDNYEIGRIKSVHDDGCFVAYHEGETGAKTPWDCIHKLRNGYCIKETSLGGEFFKEGANND